MKVLNSTGPNTNPWGTPLVTDFHLDIELDAIHYPLDETIQLIPHPPNSPSIKSIPLQFREKDVVGDHVKGLTEVQTDDSQGMQSYKPS